MSKLCDKGCVIICDFCHNFESDGSCEDGRCLALNKETTRCQGDNCESFDCFRNYELDIVNTEIN